MREAPRAWVGLCLVGAAAFLLGLGGEEAGWGDALHPLAADRPPGIPVVFRVDYPEMYGAIDVQVQGRGTLTLQENDSFSCDEPAFYHEGDTLEIGALSSRFFWWKEVLALGEETDCIEVDLTIDKTGPHIMAFRLDFHPGCYPYSVSFKYGPYDFREIWRVERQQRFDSDVFWERFDQHGFIVVADEVRKGTIVAVGGGHSFVETIVRVESIYNREICPGEAIPQLNGLAPLTLGTFSD